MAINYNDEKIGKFYQAILHYGEEQRKKIEEEVAAFKQKELDEAEIGVLTEAYHLIQKEMAQMRSGIARELAQREMDGRRALLEQRRKIMEQVFSRAAEELHAYTQKPGVLKSYVGKNVVLGVRPKDVHDDPAFVEKMEKGVVNAEVEVMESVGGESYLYLTCSGHSITAGVDADAMRQSGEQIQIAFDMEKIKLFDSDTEHTIWR